MIDRKAKITDYWENVKHRKSYQFHLKKILIPESEHTAHISIDVNSGLISLCGKNGAGKTSILHSIYRSLTNKELPFSRRNFLSEIEILNKSTNVVTTYRNGEEQFEECIFLDPSYEALIIKKVISSDSTFKEDYVDDGIESEILNEALGYIQRILCKEITSITVVEIDGKLDDSNILPYIRIYKNGQAYDNLQMGQGENKIVYLVWRLLTINNNSIILLEEPEAFLCPKSQEYFMDFLVFVIQKKKLHIILSTHSDLVLKKQSLNSCSIVKLTSNEKISLIKANSKSKYLNALGLTPPIKGVFMVEDRFAKLMLQEIFLYFSSILSNEFYIDILNGESHILEIAKHYNSSNMQFVPVLDADMIGKIKADDYLIPIYFLPSEQRLAPEAEIVAFIIKNKQLFAEAISMDTAHCLDVINQVFGNHHDWFDELNEELTFGSKVTLEKLAIKLWIESNIQSINRFVQMIESVGFNHKGILLCKDNKYYVSLSDITFYVCDKSVQKYNLASFVGQLLNFSLCYSEENIVCELKI